MIKKIILWILVISISVGIFMLSAQPATVSSDVSKGFTRTALKFIAEFSPVSLPFMDTNEKIDELASKIDGIVRKLAHYTIYLILGFFALNLFFCYFPFKRGVFFSLFYCFFYSVGDEFHQYFVPGRACMLKDVLIDFSGSITGILIASLILYFLDKSKFIPLNK